jgi:hypothetical protein
MHEMAIFKDARSLANSQDPEFDVGRDAGSRARFSGIYKCSVCGRETVARHKELLPETMDHLHAEAGRWHLLVYADPEPREKQQRNTFASLIDAFAAPHQRLAPSSSSEGMTAG